MITLIFKVLFLVSLVTANVDFDFFEDHTNFPTNTPGIIDLHGFKSESHTVLTKDGYYLTLHRITGRKNDMSNNINKNKPVVLLGHGLIVSSATFILAGPEKSIGYILSDAGYDVWLANYRGSTYSQKHTKYSNTSSQFWDFSWHEMGVYDLPAMIRYITKFTKQDKLFYLGHSQGTTVYFAFSSVFPTFAKKHLHASIALAPVVFLDNFNNFSLRMFLRFMASPFSGNISVLKVQEIMDNFKKGLNYICKENMENLCVQFIFKAAGFNEAQTNKTFLALVYKHLPTGIAKKQFLHYAQIMLTGNFDMFDYGRISNIFRYKSLFPGRYDLTKSKVKVALYHSKSDWVSTPKDVSRLHSLLANSEKRLVSSKNFTHLDFTWAQNIKEELLDDVMSFMAQFL